MAETEEYKNSNFKKARPDVSYEDNKENFYVSLIVPDEIIDPKAKYKKVPGFIAFDEFYTNPKKPTKFKKTGNVGFESFTLVKSSNVEYTLKDNKGREKVVVEVTVIDENKLFSAQDAEALKKKLPAKDSIFLIDKTFLFPVEPTTGDPPQSKIVVNPKRGIESVKDIWTTYSSLDVLADDLNFYVVHNTTEDSWFTKELQDYVFKQTKKKAVEYFMEYYSTTNPGARLNNFLNKSDIIDIHVTNRKKSKPKALVRIPKQLITADDKENESNLSVSYTLSSLSLKKFIDNLFFVTKYFKSLDPIIKKNNVQIDLIKESENLTKTASEIISVFEKNKEFPISNEDQIKINFSSGTPPKIVEMFIVPTIKKDDVVPGEEPMTSEDIDFYSDPIKIDTKGKFASKYFQDTRTMFLIINIDLMAQELGEDTNAATSKIKWIDFLNKYIYKMPEYYPSATKINNDLTSTETATRLLIEAQEQMLDSMTFAAIQDAVDSIGTGVKATIGKMRREVFEKIEDPTIKYIFENLDQINSTETLYRMVIDRIPMEDLFGMVRESLSPDPAASKWIERVQDLGFNLESVGISRQDFESKVRGKFLSFKNEAENFGKSIKEQFDMIASINDGQIYDVTEGATEELYATIKDTIDQALADAFKTILKTIKNSFIYGESDNQKSEKIGTFDIQENLKENEVVSVQNNLNTLKDVYLENFEISDILKTISDLATPMEILALFEGTADLEVVDIVGQEISLKYPILEDELISIYQKQNFFITIGKNILPSITTAIGDHEIEYEKQQKEDEEAVLSFCSPDQLNNFVDHLSGRFPQSFVQNQLKKQDLRKRNLEDFVDSLQSAIENGTIQDLLYGDKITDLLNSDKFKSRSSSLAEEMVIKSYFNPIVSMFDAESLVIDNHFTSPQVVPDNNPNTPLDPTIQIEINRRRAEGDDDEANQLQAKAQQGKKKIVVGLNEEVKQLQQKLKEGPCSYDFGSKDPARFVIGADLKKVTLEYPTIGMSLNKNLFADPDTGLAENDKFIDFQDTPEDPGGSIGKFKMIASVVEDNEEKVLFTNEKDIIFTPYMQGLINFNDTDLTHQKSAFSTLVKNIFNEKGISGENLDQVLQDIKNYIFDFSNQTLLNYTSKEASKSSFFKVANLQKLKFSPTQGDERVAVVPCKDLYSEEQGETPSTAENIVDAIITIDGLLEDIKNKKEFFRILEKETRRKIMRRTPMENAIIMGITEMFFKTVALEFLISGIFVFGEINAESLVKDKNNFKVVQDIIFFTMETIGNEFKNSFSSYLLEYAEIRQSIEDEIQAVSPMPTNLNLEEITQFILAEQIENIYKPFQKALYAVNNKTKLEINEFLDLIPNINVPKSSRVGPGFIDEGSMRIAIKNQNNSKFKNLADTYKYGGLILEKYIRVNWAPTVLIEGDLFDEIFNKPKEQVFAVMDPETGKFEWQPAGEVQSVEQSILENFLKEAAAVIQQLAKENKTDPKYKEFYKSGAYGSPEVVKSKEEILNIIKTGYITGGQEYIKTLPGYQEYLNDLKAVQDNSEEPNRAFLRGSLEGKVSPEAFAKLQQKILDINSTLEESVSNAKKELEELTSSQGQIKILKQTNKDLIKDFKQSIKPLETKFKSYADSFKKAYPVTGKVLNKDNLKNPTDEFMFIELQEKMIEDFRIGMVAALNATLGDETILNLTPEIQEFAKKYENKYSKEIIVEFSKTLSIDETIDFIQKIDQFPDSSDYAYTFFASIVKKLNDGVVSIFGGTLSNDSFTLGTYGERINKLKNDLDPNGPTLEKMSEYAVNKLQKELDKLQARASFIQEQNLTTDLDSLLSIGEKISDNSGTIVDILADQFEDYNQYEDLFLSEIKAQGQIVGQNTSKFVKGPSTNYCEPLSYGVRLSYVYPNFNEPDIGQIDTSYVKEPAAEITLLENIKSNFKKATGTYTDKNNYTEKSFKSIEIVPNPATKLVERYEVSKIPLLEVEENVSSFFKGSEPDIDNIDIAEKFPLKTMKEKMLGTDEYKSLMSEIYLYSDLISALGFYSSIHVIQEFFQKTALGIFSGTKMNIKDLFLTTTESKDFTYDPRTETLSDIMKNNIININNTTGNPSKEEGIKPDPFGYEAMVVAKTGITILKHFVEQTDPAIIRGKQIQKAIVSSIKAVDAAASSIADIAGVDAGDGTGLAAGAEAAANEGMLLPIVFFGVRPFPPIPPIPFGPGDPTAPLTPAGFTYLALTAAGGIDSVMSGGESDQEVVAKENPDQICTDE